MAAYEQLLSKLAELRTDGSTAYPVVIIDEASVLMTQWPKEDLAELQAGSETWFLNQFYDSSE